MLIGHDSHFSMGSTHDVCQDYAVSRCDDNRVIACVSDGCSSSPMSDIGSRLWCVSALRNFSKGGCIHDLVSDSLRYFVGLGLSEMFPLCMDATLGVIVQSGKTADIFLAGDGVIIERYKDGSLFISNFQSEKIGSGDAPAYPSYLFDFDRLDFYLDKVVSPRRLLYRSGYSEDLLVKKYVPDSFFWHERRDLSKYSHIIICTDGIRSFFGGDMNNPVIIDYNNVIEEMVENIGCGNAFVRRMVNILKRKSKKNGWRHYDDLGICGISISYEDSDD